MRRNLRRCAGVLVLAWAMAVVAADSPEPTAAPAAPESERRAYLDPVTGRPRAPTAEELHALPPPPAKAGAREFEEVHYPDGTVGVFPREPRRHAIGVTRKADGRFEKRCEDDIAPSAAQAGERP